MLVWECPSSSFGFVKEQNSLVPLLKHVFFSSVNSQEQNFLVTIEKQLNLALKQSFLKTLGFITVLLCMLHMKVLFFLPKCKRAQIWICSFCLTVNVMK